MTAQHPHIFLGLDLGQRQDPAALAVLERTHEFTNHRDPVTLEFDNYIQFTLRHVERFCLGLPYITIVERIARLVRDLPTMTTLYEPHLSLVVDASGVGAPVVEMLQRAGMGISIFPVIITAGEQAHPSPKGCYNIPRRDLVTRLRISLEKQTLKIPTTVHDRAALLDELLTLGDRSGARHDDLAIAVALAVYWAS
jgi:hypothetical protein